MFIQQAHLAIALIIILVLILLAFVYGASNGRAHTEEDMVYAARAGASLKVQGQSFKILPLASYRALRAEADKSSAWQWDTAGGKQR